ncbi:hypothetical protein J6500_25275 [Bradyrhizobium sp. WSM 1704]|uniref:hypothetical protein n=1 Tax=Bradyrhizobium semiaridum TaxID=2821404 RepID=UPI001CE25685|nr:hypothetical protein [Bradyrhizobium semiaridum]MCA6125181.1 hypothetical protein [Bradyrhizobium semiaridum]
MEPKKKRRRRIAQTATLEDRLLKRAEQLRKQAAALAPGIQGEALLELARQAEAGASMAEWLRSPLTLATEE